MAGIAMRAANAKPLMAARAIPIEFSFMLPLPLCDGAAAIVAPLFQQQSGHVWSEA
ncbi:hypothetical protein AB4Z10_05455 [Bosea sp. RAF48]|jgi:hypothetical protein|uniref:hypothetical protein n=1 Tax=Bosea sp. RAF48 TaxID=3237480 RepID=UPI003F8DEB1E